MSPQTAFRPAIPCTLLFAFALALGCAEDRPAAPEFHAEFGADAGTETAARAGARPANVEGRGIEIETANVFGQGLGGAVVDDAEAKIRRSANGITAKVTMAAPEPGSYAYPDDAERGRSEAFTLWVFVFDDPEAADWDGAFLGAGHAVAGSRLTLSGHISRKTDPFIGEALQNPEGAKIHLAVAPHGAVDPSKLPEQLQTPAGTPAHWWFALFE